MNEPLIVAIVFAVPFVGIVAIIRAITDYQLRRKLIQMGHVDSQSVAVLRKQRSSHLDSLKWGLIILFGGIGFIIISLPGINLESPLPYGIMSVCIAAGFLLYFVLVRRMPEKEVSREVYQP